MAVAVMAERRPAHHERGGTRLRALQAGQTEQRVEQVAHDDGEDRLGDRQAEGHDQRAVEQELHMKTAPDHSQNNPDGRILRSESGIRSFPRCSILNAAYCWGTAARD